MMIKCNFKSISLSKFGNSTDENEDNFLAPSKSECETENLVRFAISDGATESSFSKEWSDLLVCSYKDKSFDKSSFPETIKSISETWHSMATAIELPWYAEQKAETGAFATFLGLTINKGENAFEIVAVGDCTFFQITNNELKFSFPIQSIEDFGNTPNLLSTNQKYQTDFDNTICYHSGSFKSDDIFILATDAIAAWILKQNANGEKPWEQLENILNFENYNADFENWLNNQRQSNEIKNDDVTLLIIKFE